MVWQAIANGANGITFYSYNDIQRNPDVPFAQEWDRLLDVVTEIKAFAPLLLSDEGAAPPPAITGGGDAWLRVRARWVAPTLSGSADSVAAGNTTSAEYVVFAVADGSGSGSVTFTLPVEITGRVGSIRTVATPFAGGAPPRRLPSLPGTRSWTDGIGNMELVVYRVSLLAAH